MAGNQPPDPPQDREASGADDGSGEAYELTPEHEPPTSRASRPAASPGSPARPAGGATGNQVRPAEARTLPDRDGLRQEPVAAADEQPLAGQHDPLWDAGEVIGPAAGGRTAEAHTSPQRAGAGAATDSTRNIPVSTERPLPTPPISTRAPGGPAVPRATREPIAQVGGSEAEEAADVRCLACGYPLQHESEYRCPECGAQFPVGVLQRWFGGEEQQRLTLILWLVLAGLFLNLWVIPQIALFARLGLAAVLGLACYHAGRDKFHMSGGYFAGAGIAAATLMLGFSCAAQGQLVFYCLSITAVALLMLAILCERDGFWLWERSTTRLVAFGWLISAPVLALVGFNLEGVLAALLSSAGVGSPGSASQICHVLLPGLMAFACWIWLAERVWRMQRLLFGPSSSGQNRPWSF